MADEGIRLPSDSTVASQKIHRGNNLPESQTTPSQPITVAKPTPLLTVVLKSTPLLKGQKQSLFELILQNDPKSNPPIRLTADTEIKPGTSLLLALDAAGQYQPIEKPSPAQLQQLVKLELEFWRTQLLPKANLKSAPTLPAVEQLKVLGEQFPSLKPLLDVLTVQSQSVSSPTIQRWLQQFQSITTAQKPIAILQPENQQNAADALKTALSVTASATTPAQRLTTTPIQPSQPGRLQSSTQPVIIADLRLTQPVGKQAAILPTPVIVAAINAKAPLVGTPDLTSATGRDPKPVTSMADAANSKLTFTGQLFRLSDPQLFNQAQTIQTVIRSHIQFTRAITGEPGVSADRSANTTPPAMVSVTAQAKAVANSNQPVIIDVNKLNGQLPSFTETGTQQPAASLTQQNIKLIPWPNNALPVGRIPTTVSREALPIEFRLNAWLTELTNTINSQSNILSKQLQQQAEQLLSKTQPPPIIENSAKIDAATKSSTDPDNADQALLQLRSALETTLSRIQHAAVQTALQQWTMPDQPIQHMHLPLIWLGLTHWADFEWWQEKKPRDKSKDKEKSVASIFKMRMFLTLDPLAEFCAELEQANNMTQLTFWSEDQSTLSHLHNLMPTLEQWTQGLGEHRLQTKHGMPKRKTQVAETAAHQHLVDIRT